MVLSLYFNRPMPGPGSTLAPLSPTQTTHQRNSRRDQILINCSRNHHMIEKTIDPQIPADLKTRIDSHVGEAAIHAVSSVSNEGEEIRP